MSTTEPRNPFYMLLLITGVVLCVTALAYAVVPILEEQAHAAGQDPPPSPFRDALRHDGWKWLLIEVGVLIVLGLASMGLDHYRRVRGEKAEKEKTFLFTVDAIYVNGNLSPNSGLPEPCE